MLDKGLTPSTSSEVTSNQAETWRVNGRRGGGGVMEWSDEGVALPWVTSHGVHSSVSVSVSVSARHAVLGGVEVRWWL